MNRQEFEKAVYDPANGLTASQVGILLWYANHKNWKKDGLAWGSAETIAKEVRYGARTVEGARPLLVERGWLIDSGKRAFNAKGRPTVMYDLGIGTFPAAPADKSDDLSRNECGEVEDEDSDLFRSSDGLSRNHEGTFPQSEGYFPATVAEEHDKEHVIEHETEHVAPTADAAVARYHFVIREDAHSPILPNHANVANPVYVMDLEGVTGPLTVDSRQPVQRFLTPGELKDFERQVRIHKVSTQDAAQALTVLKGTAPSRNIDEAIADALASVGVVVEVEEW